MKKAGGRINQHKSCAWCGVSPLPFGQIKYCGKKCLKKAWLHRMYYPKGAAPPKCIGCREKPVKRAWGNQVHKELGPRMVDGIKWRWFCSWTCNGIYRGRVNTGKGLHHAARKRNIDKARQRMVDRLVKAVKPHMDEQGKVYAKDFVTMFIKEVRRERMNAATIRFLKRRKDRDAWEVERDEANGWEHQRGVQ